MISEEPPSFLSQTKWSLLQKIYSAPDEIDLYIGGIMETTRRGMPGPTFTCINGKQFESLLKGKFKKKVYFQKYFFFCLGDRFFFTHVGQYTRFKFMARKQLNRRRFRDIVCQNTKIQTAQINLFKTRGSKVPCSQINPLDISFFV